ncbi:MAG: ATP phosphoribosyltransferase [Clostridiales bacterium]|nr:ATP phosphoribosyltransferase [Clostridiales bacterium]MCF8022981.1 ATP phosphoribosyltransferase [Clostridiales bacterium]
MPKLRLGLPKGSLQDSTFQLFKKAGFNISVRNRSYFPSIDDSELEVILMRAREIPRYVSEGVLDAGISGLDWIKETGAGVVHVADLAYSKQTNNSIRLVIAVAQDSSIKDIQDLQGKRIATELVSITRHYLEEKGIDAVVEYSHGATEVKVPELVDAIADLTETGSSLKANKLRVIDTILESTTKIHANIDAWEDQWKKDKLQNLNVLLQGALQAETKAGLKMNLPKDSLEEVLCVLPAMKHPTVSQLMNNDWMAVEVVLDERQARDLIPELRRCGAQDIIEYPLNKVII